MYETSGPMKIVKFSNLPCPHLQNPCITVSLGELNNVLGDAWHIAGAHESHP